MMTEEEKKQYARDWIIGLVEDGFEFTDLVEALQFDDDIDDNGKTAREIADLVFSAKVDVSWD